MYSQVQVVLERYGYENIPLNARGIYLALRQMQEKSCVVVTLDEMVGDRLGTEQFYHISEQIREYLMGRGCTHCIFLYLLISDDDSSAGRIFKNYECFWRISPKRGQLMVFEREEEAFMVLRRPLEELLERQESFENVERRQLPWCNIAIILINVAVFLYTDFLLYLVVKLFLMQVPLDGMLFWRKGSGTACSLLCFCIWVGSIFSIICWFWHISVLWWS